jgi:phosphoenolpyruvate carboxylase
MIALHATCSSTGISRSVRRQCTFWITSARLDLREDSGVLSRSFSEILRALHIHYEFEHLTEIEKTKLLDELFASPSPELAPEVGVTISTARTWALFCLIKRAVELYGHQTLGPFIISMARAPSDVLIVLMLARWAGCPISSTSCLCSMADLQAADQVLENSSTPAYLQHLERRLRMNGDDQLLGNKMGLPGVGATRRKEHHR